MATCRPRNHANAGPIHGGAGGEGMKETHVSVCQGCPDVRFRNVPAEIHAEFERTFRFQRRLFSGFVSIIGSGSRGKCG